MTDCTLTMVYMQYDTVRIVSLIGVYLLMFLASALRSVCFAFCLRYVYFEFYILRVMSTKYHSITSTIYKKLSFPTLFTKPSTSLFAAPPPPYSQAHYPSQYLQTPSQPVCLLTRTSILLSTTPSPIPSISSLPVHS